jgi:hypothetical protein
VQINQLKDIEKKADCAPEEKEKFHCRLVTHLYHRRCNGPSALNIPPTSDPTAQPPKSE